MEESSHTQDSKLTFNITIGIISIGLIIIVLFIVFCICKRKRFNEAKGTNTNSVESFEELFFTTTSMDQIKQIDQQVIERWSSINQPPMTFYRVYVQENFNDFYKPITEKRLHSAMEQSKAMEYAGVEIVFF